MSIEQELGCLGYYGFGGGYAEAHARATGSRQAGKSALYCNSCSLKQPCWEAHKVLVAKLFPALVEQFEKMAKETQGPALIRRWLAEVSDKRLDPYSTVMLGNIQDGISIREVGKVTERGEATIPWPLKVH